MSDTQQLTVPPAFPDDVKEKADRELAQIANGQPAGLDGVGVIEATPPGQAVIPPEA